MTDVGDLSWTSHGGRCPSCSAVFRGALKAHEGTPDCIATGNALRLQAEGMQIVQLWETVRRFRAARVEVIEGLTKVTSTVNGPSMVTTQFWVKRWAMSVVTKLAGGIYGGDNLIYLLGVFQQNAAIREAFETAELIDEGGRFLASFCEDHFRGEG